MTMAADYVYPVHPPPFDPYLCEQFFPRVPDGDDTVVTQALLKRHQELVPTKTEQANIQQMVTFILQRFEAIIADPTILPDVQIAEAREVGSYKRDTMIHKSNIADIVVIFKSLPTVEHVSAVANKIVADLKNDKKETYVAVMRPHGCEISGILSVVKFYISMVPDNTAYLVPDIHMPESVLRDNMAKVRQAHWFTENCNTSSMRAFIRCIKDMRRRFDGWKPLIPWHIDLICHYAMNHTSNGEPLTLSHAFKRFLQLLACGLLLPYQPSLPDPCNRGLPITAHYTHEQMDAICSAAQTMLRILLHGGINALLGLENNTTDVTQDVSYYKDVVVTPLEKAVGNESETSGIAEGVLLTADEPLDEPQAEVKPEVVVKAE